VRVFGYCLMTNHYHMVVAGETERSVSRAIGRANWEYSIIRHQNIGRKGQLWQGRYGSCLLDDSHFWAALCYVERNPMAAGMVVNAWDWPWSSAQAHIGMEADDWLDRGRWEERYDATTWKRALEVGIHDEALEERIALGKIWFQTNPVVRHCGKGVGKLVAEGGYGVDAARASGW
jgi:putative transposase